MGERGCFLGRREGGKRRSLSSEHKVIKTYTGESFHKWWGICQFEFASLTTIWQPCKTKAQSRIFLYKQNLIIQKINFFFIQYFRLLFTYPPLVAGRLPDGKKPLTPKPTEFPEGFMASDLKNHWKSIWFGLCRQESLQEKRL